MKIELTTEQAKYVAKKMATGRYASAADVVAEAFRVLRNVERVKPLADAELRREIQVGLDELEAGRGSEWNVEEAKERLRQTLRDRVKESKRGKSVRFDGRVVAGIRRRGMKKLAKINKGHA